MKKGKNESKRSGKEKGREGKTREQAEISGGRGDKRGRGGKRREEWEGRAGL